MKTYIKILAFLLLSFSLTTIVFADDSVKTNSVSTYDKIEKNLLLGLKSNNDGLIFSCAYFLGEIKSTKAVIPLMRLLHNGKTEEMRIIAALSLYKIKSDRGIYAIKRLIKFADNDRVRRMCTNFYYQHLLNQREGEVKVGEIQPAVEVAFGGYKLNDFEN